MAKIVDLTSTERPVPRIGGAGAPRPGPGPSDAAARGLQQLGVDIGAGTEEIFRAERVIEEKVAREQKVEEDRLNTLRAEEAYTKLRERQLDLSIGEQSGFTQQRGAAAVTRPLFKEWGKRFDDVEREVEGTLSNDAQRQRYKLRSGVARLQFQQDMLQHLAREGDAYAKQVYDGIVDTEQRNAVAHWDSPYDVASSLERVRNAVLERAERGGWAPEYREAVLQKENGKVHSAVVAQALATGNFRYAQQWYEEHRGDVDIQTAKTLEKAVEDGTQKELSNAYNTEYLANEDSPRSLEALRHRVLKDTALGEDRKNILVGRIQNRQSVLERKLEVAETKRLRVIERGIADLNGSTLAGFEPTAEQFAPLLSAAKGTELEPEVRQAMALATQTRSFRTLPPVVQERVLSEGEAGIRNQPGKFDRLVVSAWRTIHDSQRRQVMDSPVSFAVAQGIIEPPLPVDLSMPAQAGPALAERFAIARGVAARYQAPFKPLTPEEVTLLKNTLNTATVEQRRNYFGELAQAAAGDVQGYMGIMAQFAPDEPVVAIAGSHAARGRSSEADLMLRGAAILKPNTKADGKPDGSGLLPMPPELDLRMRFDGYVREAFSGKAEARNAHFQAAKAIYAALSVDAGDRDTKVLDADRWERAMTLAIGPVEKHQGRRIVMPHGYEYASFRDGLRARLDQVVEGGAMDPSWTASRLRDLPLENVGDGRYVLRSGDGVVADKQGRPVILDFNVSLPFKSSGAGLAPRPDPTADELAAAARPATGRALPRPDRPSAVAGR
jgi:hypothetical protein